MNNTLQLFWSGGLHIAKIFILHKKNIQLTKKKEESKKNTIWQIKTFQFLPFFFIGLYY
ncbi:Uncharacterised protein [Klebsiella pneumoniae]|uniref:Uncharacterized protein n=1 Tax=Klebsiella pneumoniae TaxID=573 RepID=A0A3G4RIN4_KLEPN|nr:hypothetical protein [Klebsiella pneumoniae]VAN63117.1 Uncharacterised protein [Klebsiella pneumoniae]